MRRKKIITEEATTEIQQVTKQPTVVVVPVYNGPRYEYKMLAATGGIPSAAWVDSFNKLGAEGWDFVGTESHGRSVFRRPL